MKYAILFSLLLVGVYADITSQKRPTHDDSQRMRNTDTMDMDKKSSEEKDSAEMKNMESNSQKQSYNSWRQGSDSQKQGINDRTRQSHDTQRESHDSQSRTNDYQRQSSEYRRQEFRSRDHNSEKPKNFQSRDYDYDTPIRTLPQNSNWKERDYDFDTRTRTQPKNMRERDDFDTRTRTRNMNWREGDYNQKLFQSEKREDSHLNLEKEVKTIWAPGTQSNNQRPQGYLGLDRLAKNVGDYIRGIFGWGSSDSKVAKVYSNEIPSFVDPLDIGAVDTSFALITTKYNDVYFYGLKNAYTVVMEVDTKNQQIEAKIPLNKVEIKGQYTYSGRPAHNFTIMLADTYYVQTTSYTIKDNAVQWGRNSSQIEYSRENSYYDRIGFVAQVVQGQLGKNLVNSVAPKVYEYIGPKLTGLIERTVLDVTQNFERAQIVSSLQAGVNETVRKINEHLASSGNANVELNGKGPQEYEFQYLQYKAQLKSVSLQNIQNLTLYSNKVTYTDKMVHSHINLSVSEPIISAFISYQNLKDSQQHEIQVQYSVDYIHANVELHKDLSGGQLQLVGVKVYVSKLHAAPSQGHYTGDIGSLVHSLGSKLEQYVSQSVQDFLTSQISGILAKVNSTRKSFSGAGEGYRNETGYNTTGGAYSTTWKYGKGEYSGSGHTDMGQYGSGHPDMGQYGSGQSSGHGNSGYDRQRYPGSME